MFNRKRIEAQENMIECLQHECRKLKEQIESLTKENNRLKADNKRLLSLEKLSAESEQQEEPYNPPKKNNRVFEGITLSDEQDRIVDLLENTNDNYFITGRAGSGKSTILSCFRKTTRKSGVAVVALSGTAALNVEGQTIHSLFRMGLEPQDTSSKIKIEPGFIVAETLRAINVLIIDEVSMVRSDIMDMMDAKMKAVKKNKLPFGGCQVIALGDLYQLPPIAKDQAEREFIEERYGTLFFFGAPAARDTFNVIELKDVVRQKDPEFINLLNQIRIGSISDAGIQTINKRYAPYNIPDDCIRLTLTNEIANSINKQKLALINAKEYQFETQLGGSSPPSREDIPFDFDLKLKVGARIMTTKNDPGGKYTNGSIGVVTSLSQNSIRVNINGKEFDVEHQTWVKKIYKYDREKKDLTFEIVGWAKQYPIRLAWAITVHKSQGQTYDKVVIDYSNRTSFAAGQTYVALSRCRTLDGIYLTRPLTSNDIHVEASVKRYMENNISIKSTTKNLSTREEKTPKEKTRENPEKVRHGNTTPALSYDIGTDEIPF
jgi:ATP-dependent exoDNAse (exonuclease V) alpha subunit/regulator of replication initiation timing